MRQKYTLADYNKGNPKLNLARMERVLLIKALIKSNWNMSKALKLNFPFENISRDGYAKILGKHHISLRDKSFKKLTEIK